MPRIYMIRHGKAAAGWDADADPGLDDLGRKQAEAAADDIEKRVGAPLPVLSSPLRRCRETAEPLSGRWGLQPVIEPRVAEVPSPVEDLRARGEWLRSIMAGTWADAVAAGDGKHTAYDSKLLAWRQSVVDALLELENDTVIFSHFIAINTPFGETKRVQVKVEMQGSVISPIKASISIDSVGKQCIETGENLYNTKIL